MESDNDVEYDNNYESEGTADDNLLRKIGIIDKMCKEYEIIIKRLKMESRLSKSHVRPTKRRQIRIDYDWGGKEGNFAYLVSTFIKE